MIVVDTNVIVYFLIPSDSSEIAEQVREIDPVWLAPFLWRSEALNVLIGYVRNGMRSLTDVQIDMANAERLFAGRESDVDSKRVLELAYTSGCTAYDCEFVALAEELNARLVTSDKKILSAFPSIAISMKDFIAT